MQPGNGAAPWKGSVMRKTGQTLSHQLHTDAHDAREPVDSAQVQRDLSDLHSQWLPTEDRGGKSQRMVVQGQD